MPRLGQRLLSNILRSDRRDGNRDSRNRINRGRKRNEISLNDAVQPGSLLHSFPLPWQRFRCHSLPRWTSGPSHQSQRKFGFVANEVDDHVHWDFQMNRDLLTVTFNLGTIKQVEHLRHLGIGFVIAVGLFHLFV